MNDQRTALFRPVPVIVMRTLARRVDVTRRDAKRACGPGLSTAGARNARRLARETTVTLTRELALPALSKARTLRRVTPLTVMLRWYSLPWSAVGSLPSLVHRTVPTPEVASAAASVTVTAFA